MRQLRRRCSGPLEEGGHAWHPYEKTRSSGRFAKATSSSLWHCRQRMPPRQCAQRATLSTLVNERARMSPGMALPLEKAFAVSMQTLMRMQNSFDIAQPRKRENRITATPFKGTPGGDGRPDYRPGGCLSPCKIKCVSQPRLRSLGGEKIYARTRFSGIRGAGGRSTRCSRLKRRHDRITKDQHNERCRGAG